MSFLWFWYWNEPVLMLTQQLKRAHLGSLVYVWKHISKWLQALLFLSFHFSPKANLSKVKALKKQNKAKQNKIKNPATEQSLTELNSGEISTVPSHALKKRSFPAFNSCPSTGDWQSSKEKGQNKSVVQQSGLLGLVGSLFTLFFLFPRG